MKVFISWSGNRSKEVANLLSDWLCCVIQAVRPWVSTRDLDRGSLWFGEINDQLKDTSVGIICLTQENKDRPWILFEAGALAKGLSTARVCTLLIDLESKDIQDPLAQFNHTFPNKESFLGLVKTLNSTLGVNSLDNRILEQVFSTYWSQFDEKFKYILTETATQTPQKPRPQNDVLGEILENTRMLNNRIRRLESDVEINKKRVRNPDASIDLIIEVQEMLKRGVPSDIVIERLSNMGIPKDYVRDLIKNMKLGE